MAKIKRNVFGGFNARQVKAYIKQIQQEYEETLLEKQNHMEQMKQEKRELLDKLKNSTEKESSVMNAVFRAEQEAKEILQKAEKEREAIYAQHEVEIQDYEERIALLKKGLSLLVERFSGELEDYENSLAEIKFKEIQERVFGDVVVEMPARIPKAPSNTIEESAQAVQETVQAPDEKTSAEEKTEPSVTPLPKETKSFAGQPSVPDIHQILQKQSVTINMAEDDRALLEKVCTELGIMPPKA